MNEPAQDISTTLYPLTDLSAENLKVLTDKAQVGDLPAKAPLTAADSSKWFVYLLSGTLAVVKNDGTPLKISGGSSDSKNPIFMKGRDHGKAVCLTQCRIIRFERLLYETLVTKDSLDGYEVNDVQISDAEGVLFQELYAACAQKDLQLPTMPEVATRIAELADDPDAGVPELTRVIQMEPAVAGSILKVANSPLYRGTAEIDNIRNAVIRLGLKVTRDLATSIALREVFSSKNKAIQARMQSAWEHSVNISSRSYALAKKTGTLDPERALMAGLLHDIGEVAILTHMDRCGLDGSPEDLDATIRKLRTMAGTLVMSHWGLAADLSQITEAAEDWWRDPGPDPDYGDVVMISHLCHHDEPKMDESVPEIIEIPAAAKLGLDTLDDRLECPLLKEIEQETAGIKAMLS